MIVSTFNKSCGEVDAISVVFSLCSPASWLFTKLQYCSVVDLVLFEKFS